MPSVRVMSEPYGLADIQRLWRFGHWTHHEAEKAAISAMKLYLKPRKASKYNFVIIKHCVWGLQFYPTFIKVFPDHKWIFNTRRIETALKSNVKMKSSLPSHFLNGPLFTKFYWSYAPIKKDDNELIELVNQMTLKPANYTLAESDMRIGTST